ncbi:MAG: DNA-binding protein [Anaerolineales bacterium]|nr:DNA-binding protein [Anaerolineales bacterium]
MSGCGNTGQHQQRASSWGTITNDEYIHDALRKNCQEENIHAATFEMLGGDLTQVEFTEYNFINKMREEPLFFARPLEILSGHGTISSLMNEPHVHLHLTLSYQDEVPTQWGGRDRWTCLQRKSLCS